MNRLYHLIFMACLLFLLTGVSSLPANGQDTTAAPAYGWTNKLLFGAGLTQASYTDWASGGENALSYIVTLDGFSADSQQTSVWATTYRFAFGQSRLGDQGLRKTEDKMELVTRYTYLLESPWGLYGAATFRSQFAKGYEYADDETRTAISDVFDPAYFTQTAGASWTPGPVLTTRIGAGMRQTVTSKHTVFADDPETDEIENFLFQGILESVTDLTWNIDENILFTSKLELIAPFDTFDKILVRSDNALLAKVSDIITATLNLELVNDWRVTRKTQIRQTMSFGISYAIL